MHSTDYAVARSAEVRMLLPSVTESR